ncbi:lactosylceramide 4-alpha-galactosyltransferase-like [Neocloeon triangulifer]|uniref:lactosylceramide 4-alpha-galactosyltransferase-like n=1 Tax=Neocloeon triangulifer TaxID=2078957 RepID=UPI00286F98D9|nr:lactosylceramide 4-alpha-galactosyltransferase-like [Neocloeon triangulifer]
MSRNSRILLPLLVGLIVHLAILIYIVTPNRKYLFHEKIVIDIPKEFAIIEKSTIGDFTKPKDDGANQVEVTDALDTLEARNTSRKAIFFIETSKRGTINPRQVCSIESAAKYNPFADVYLLLLDPPVNSELLQDEGLQLVVRHYENVRVVQTSSERYFNGTSLESLWNSGKIGESLYPVENWSNAMRILTILRFGGIYFDLDMIIFRPLDDLPANWISFETPHLTSNSAFGFQKGEKFAQKILEEFNSNFNGEKWGINGPQLINRMLQRECNMTLLGNTKSDECPNIVLFPPTVFHPLNYGWRLLFEEDKLNEVIIGISSSLGIHLWNHLSSKDIIRVGSKQPYGVLAQNHCPRAYWSCYKTF